MKLIISVLCVALLVMSINVGMSFSLKTQTSTKTKMETILTVKVKATTSLKANSKLSYKSNENKNVNENMLEFLNNLKTSSSKSEKSNSNENISESMIENYENSNQNTSDVKPVKKGSQQYHNLETRFGFANATDFNVNDVLPPQENPDVIMEDAKNLHMLKQGWLQISSPDLKNTLRYPKLNLPDLNEHEIPTEKNYFRVNEGFDPLRNPHSGPGPFYFWFRLSWRNLYYSLGKNNINVVGAMPIKNIQDATRLDDFHRNTHCLKIFDVEHMEWVLCGQTSEIRNAWLCKIRAVKKFEDEKTCLQGIAESPAIVERKVTQPIILLPQASRMCNENFNYEQHGMDWECDCKEGMTYII